MSLILHETGRLEYPYGEKVDGEENMFAMRIRKGGNFREFYAYDDGTCVWLLNGYEKKNEKDSDGGIEESQEDQKEIRIMNKKLSAKQMALREACIKESRGYFEKEWSRPDFAEGMKKFRQEYAMNVAMHQAKMESGLSQTAIAERMGIPRPNVSRIEHSRSVSFDTFCAYLKACGFAFSFALIPNS